MAARSGGRPAYDRDAAQAARKATLESMHSQLAERIGSLDSLQAWGAWLRFASSFHRYSFNNTVLIWAQKPEATMVAGYRAWQAKGRQVRRGETAIKVFGPVTTREPKLDAQGRPIRDADGKPVQDVRIVGVKPVSVFDVSQTDGDPLPEPPQATLLTGQAPPGLWDALQTFVEAQGYAVSRGDCGDANGVTMFDARQVRVRADIDDAAAVKTLAHEAGHVLLHAPDQLGPHQAVPVGPSQVDILTSWSTSSTPRSASCRWAPRIGSCTPACDLRTEILSSVRLTGTRSKRPRCTPSWPRGESSGSSSPGLSPRVVFAPPPWAP
jgi:hypothetical protein